MMPPGGLREDTTDLKGDGYLDLKNVIRWESDGIQQRPGLSNRVDQGGRAIATFTDSSGNTLVLTAYSGSIYRANTAYGSSGAQTVTGMSATAKGCFVKADERLYYADGTAFKYIDRDLDAGDAGITAPASQVGDATVATGGSMDVGVHSYRYRYYDSATGYLSDPSEPNSVELTPDTSPYGSKFTLTYGTGSQDIVASTQTGKVDKVIIEVTPGNSTKYYDAYVINNPTSSGTHTVDLSDAELRSQLRRAGGALVGNSPPPNAPIVTEHRGRLFGTGVSGSENLLYWSGPGLPEGWNTVSQARVVLNDSNDTPTALLSAFGDLYIIGLYTMSRMAYTSDPAAAYLETLPTTLGAWNHRCVLWVENRVFGAGPNGFWEMRGMLPNQMSDPIKNSLESINRSQTDIPFLVHDPVVRNILYFYPSTGSSVADKCLTYNYASGEWSEYEFDATLQAGCTGLDDEDRARAWLCDESYSWYLKRNVWDSVKVGDPTTVTVTSVSGSTVINVSEVLTADGSKGAYLYDPSTSGTRQVTTNDVGSFTISSGFTSNPSSGSQLYVGSFEWKIAPKWLRGDKSRNLTRSPDIGISFIHDSSSGTHYGKFRVYDDFSSTPLTFTKSESDTFSNGYHVTNGQDYAEIDFGLEASYVTATASSEWNRYWRWVMEARRPFELNLVDVDWSPEPQDVGRARE